MEMISTATNLTVYSPPAYLFAASAFHILQNQQNTNTLNSTKLNVTDGLNFIRENNQLSYRNTNIHLNDQKLKSIKKTNVIQHPDSIHEQNNLIQLETLLQQTEELSFDEVMRNKIKGLFEKIRQTYDGSDKKITVVIQGMQNAHTNLSQITLTWNRFKKENPKLKKGVSHVDGIFRQLTGMQQKTTTLAKKFKDYSEIKVSIFKEIKQNIFKIKNLKEFRNTLVNPGLYEEIFSHIKKFMTQLNNLKISLKKIEEIYKIATPLDNVNAIITEIKLIQQQV